MPTHSTAPSGDERSDHPDPITGEPGAHLVGTGIGATAGGVAGAAIGSVAGPIGTVVGVAIGSVAGGLAGKGVAEAIDPTAEEAYWRENHQYQPYADKERAYDAYARAYRTGYAGYRDGLTFDDREADLRMEYEGASQRIEAEDTEDPQARKIAESALGPTHYDPTTSPLRWDDAREAARAAYLRVERRQKKAERPIAPAE